MVFFFDEANLLFRDAPKALIEKVEQVVRLIRSKGVGVYFVTQNPGDLPDAVLGQMGNRFQHALRAFTPRDRKAVKTAAETFVENPALDVAKAIGMLGIRSEEHTSELQSLMRISYAVFCLKKKNQATLNTTTTTSHEHRKQ